MQRDLCEAYKQPAKHSLACVREIRAIASSGRWHRSSCTSCNSVGTPLSELCVWAEKVSSQTLCLRVDELVVLCAL